MTFKSLCRHRISQVEAFFPSVFFYFILCFHSLTEYTDKEKEQNSFLLSKRLRDLKVLECTEQFCKCIAIESVSSNDL